MMIFLNIFTKYFYSTFTLYAEKIKTDFWCGDFKNTWNLADYCLNLQRDYPGKLHGEKSNKRKFLTDKWWMYIYLYPCLVFFVF